MSTVATRAHLRALPLWLPLLVLGLLAWSRRGIPLNHDVAWFIVAAERLLAGGDYGLDVFEVNAPLAILIYAPPLLAANWLGTGIPSAATGWTLALIAQSLLLIRWMAAHSTDAWAPRLGSAWTLAWFCVPLVLLPGYEFGQREHLTAILALPWLCYLALGRDCRARGAVAYALVLAALGCFLKPHFAPLPFLLLFLPRGAGGWRARLSSREMAIPLLLGLSYAVLIAWRYPDWYGCVRWAADLYGYYGDPTFAAIFGLERTRVALALLLLLFGLWLHAPRARAALLPLALAAAYGFLAYLLQRKGWDYHILPTLIFAMAALPLLVDVKAVEAARAWRRPVVWIGVLLAAGSFAYAVRATRTAYGMDFLAVNGIAEAISPARPGDSVYIFSTSVKPFLPATTYAGLSWGSRYSALWPVSALGRSAAGDARVAHLQRLYATPFMESVAVDLERNRPDLVLVDLRTRQVGFESSFDFIGYFSQHAAFRAAWSQYVEIGRSDFFRIFARKTGTAPATERREPPAAAVPADG